VRHSLVRSAVSAIVITLSAATASAAPASAAPPSQGSTSGISIPVVLWHVVSTTPQGRYQYDLAKFKQQMAYLHDNGYTPLSAAEYHSVMSLQTPPPAKPILLTFDDSTSDFQTNVLPVLQQYGFKAVQFAVCSWLDTAGHLTSAQVAALPTQGIDVENHTMDHSDLSTMSYDAAYAEISQCDAQLTSITGIKPTFLAYPNGRTDAGAESAARADGVTDAFTVAAGKTTPSDDQLALNRYMIASSDTLSTFISKVS
jgi:peptidoglycan/xylan/chitin deacetylase (PgdA/CDA1 family)